MFVFEFLSDLRASLEVAIDLVERLALEQEANAPMDSDYTSDNEDVSDQNERHLVDEARIVSLVDITGTIILVLYLSVKSLQLIWWPGTSKLNLQVPSLQMSCRDLITWQGTWPAMAAVQHAPLLVMRLLIY